MKQKAAALSGDGDDNPVVLRGRVSSTPTERELPSGALIVWTLTLAGMTAVPTPGFFGGFEASCSAALMMLGGDADRARTFAVLLHLGQFAFTVCSGVLFLVLEGLSLRELVDRSRRAEAA